ncbi:unnamed protein product [Cercospora beticola]|nr:unnamed protein product [Cercospora beticola]
MKFTLATATFLVSLFGQQAIAGYNCKCQDPSGTGPQWYRASFFCCLGDAGTVNSCWNSQFPGPNHQCTGGGDNCIDSGAFNQCCIDHGAPGAFCWE